MNFVKKINVCFTIVCIDYYMPDLPIQGLKCLLIDKRIEKKLNVDKIFWLGKYHMDFF